MGDGVRAGFLGDLYQPLRDERAGDRCAQQVVALVERVCAEHREYEVPGELLPEILDPDVLDPQKLGLVPCRLQILLLAQVGREGHHLGTVLNLQPLEYDGGVEASRIGQHNLQRI